MTLVVGACVFFSFFFFLIRDRGIRIIYSRELEVILSGKNKEIKNQYCQFRTTLTTIQGESRIYILY